MTRNYHELRNNIIFSLIVATVNRTGELENLFCSLSKQVFKQFEVILMDQNTDGRLDELVAKYQPQFSIIHHKSSLLGLSVNRNIGLTIASGSVIGFPDDDCEYPSDLLLKVSEKIDANSVDIVTGATIDKVTGECYLSSPGKKRPLAISSIFRSAISFTIFIKPRQFGDIQFDELLGVGAEFGSSEETDLMISLLHLGYNGIYDPSVIVYHPNSKKEQSVLRIFTYAKGFGAIHRKWAYKFNGWFLFRFLLFIGYNSINILFFRCVKKNCISLKGKMTGFFHYPGSTYKQPNSNSSL